MPGSGRESPRGRDALPVGPGVRPEARPEVGGRVRADREERHVAEVEQAGEADDDVEPERHDHVRGGEHHVVEDVAAGAEAERRDPRRARARRRGWSGVPERRSHGRSQSLGGEAHRAGPSKCPHACASQSRHVPVAARRSTVVAPSSAPSSPLEVAPPRRRRAAATASSRTRERAAERPLGELAARRLEPHQRAPPVRGIRSRAPGRPPRAGPPPSPRGSGDAHRVGQHVDRSAVRPLRSETSAAGRPPAIPVAASVASRMPSLIVSAIAPRRFASRKVCVSGI